MEEVIKKSNGILNWKELRTRKRKSKPNPKSASDTSMKEKEKVDEKPKTYADESWKCEGRIKWW